MASKCSIFTRRAAIVRFTALIAGAGPLVLDETRGAAAPKPACNERPAPLLAFDDVRGVRTKWRSLARDERNTIEPDMAGLPLKAWMANLEAVGINLAEINLDPVNKLATQPSLSDRDLMQGVGAVYTPDAERTDTQRARLYELQRDIIPQKGYTAAQRDQVQLDFLRRLEDLRRRGEITGSVRFLVHQRLWFRPVRNWKTEQKEHEHATEFIDDMASFIRQAESNCLGHWLAGVRLGEHSNNNMNELLPLLVELARGINDRTGGWLKGRLFLANGGGWGAEYNGINQVVGADGRPYQFLALMAAEAGGFAFGYKWMQFHDGLGADITSHIADAECAPGRGCDPNSVADWETYLGRILGFNDLVAYIKAHRAQYPRHANVVFLGDSSDAATGLTRVGNDGRMVDGPALIALRRLFAKAGPSGFRGRVFMNGYSTAETMRHLGVGGSVDIGRALYYGDGSSKARLLLESRQIWQRWPAG